MKMEANEIIRALVPGIHAGKNSEEAAGVVSEDYRPLGKPTKALYIAFDVSCSYYPTAEQKEKKIVASSDRMSLHYLFHRPFGSNGFCTTYTFGAVNGKPFAGIKEVDFKFLSSHDSCWIDMVGSYSQRASWDLYERVISRAGFSENNAPAYNDMSWNVWFLTRSVPTAFYQWVDIQINPKQKYNEYELKVL